MIKKLIVLIAAFFLAFSFGNILLQEKAVAISSVEPIQKKVETRESLCIDVEINGDGYYALMSDAEIHYGENEIDYIYLNDPILLAFNVSSEYNGGVWVLDLDEGEKILSELAEVNEALKANENGKLSERVEYAIQLLENSGPFTYAST